MSQLYTQGVANAYEPMQDGLIPQDVASVAREWFPNRHPLYLRFRHESIGSDSWTYTNQGFRPRSTRLTANINDSVTAVPVLDATMFEVDDILKIDNEYMLVTAITDATHLAVTRAYAGTTAAAHTAGSSPNQLVVWLISNARTGYQEDVAAMIRTHEAYTNWVQTVQSAYKVGGSFQANTNYLGGSVTPLAREKMDCMRRVLDQIEVALYYGRKIPRDSATAKPATAGLEQQIVSNNFYQPTNYAAYTPADFIRDTIQPICDAGGSPTHMLLSTDWLSGLYTWGGQSVRTTVEESVLGVNVTSIQVPFLNNVVGIIAPLLRKGTAIVLTEPEVAIKVKRELFDKPRGSRGDADGGDMILEAGLELEVESHHAMVSGITGFTVPANVNVVVNVPEPA